MSLTIPLAVRLVTSRSDRVVTRELRSLRFRSVAPGGFASAALSLDRPLSLQPDEIGYYGKLYITDARNGRVVWEGRLEDQARGSGSDGQVWQLVALGPSAHARDRKVPLIYVDRGMRNYVRAENVTPGMDALVSTDPNDTTNGAEPAIVMRSPSGLAVSTNSRVAMRYAALIDTGQKLARFDYTWSAGTTSALYLIKGIARSNGSLGSGDVARSQALSAAGSGSLPKVIATDWTTGRNTLDLQMIYTGGAGTETTDSRWVAAMGVVVMATRYDKTGSELLTGASYTTNTVLSSDVVADLLGRLLTQYDGANASIATTSYGIEHLAYPDGIDPAGVLDDLMTLDAGYYWAVWESNATTGKYRFEWVPWPTTVRYEADATDGFDSPASADGLYDAVRVRWRDALGSVRANRRTQTVAALTAAGITREGLIDLGDEVGTSANADRAGDQWLAERAAPPNAGRLTIARPIFDATWGRMVQPWEILPGQLIRVRGVLPRTDALNATTRDGVTIFKIASVEYGTDSASAVLELDSYALSTARALATQARQSTTLRRR
jgi:hypothetical protein